MQWIYKTEFLINNKKNEIMKDEDIREMTKSITFFKRHPEFKKTIIDLLLHDDMELCLFFELKSEDCIYILNLMKYLEGMINYFFYKDDIKNRDNIFHLYKRCVNAVGQIATEPDQAAQPKKFTNTNNKPDPNTSRNIAEHFMSLIDKRREDEREIKIRLEVAKRLNNDSALNTAPPPEPPQQFTKQLTTEQQKYLTCTLETDKLKTINKELIKNGFLAHNTTDEAFIYVFGGNGNANDFNPLKWIKTVETTKNVNINKRSLLDLLELMAVPFDEITNKNLLNRLFAKDDGNTIKFTSSNYTDTQNNFNSEYHKQLKTIVK